jgi:putative FmdB family regulatory protein
MPTYEYRCKSCEHEMEAFQSIKDAPLQQCPACRQPQLERLISATSFQLKVGGWYKDLYSSSSSKNSKSDKAA